MIDRGKGPRGTGPGRTVSHLNNLPGIGLTQEKIKRTRTQLIFNRTAHPFQGIGSQAQGFPGSGIKIQISEVFPSITDQPSQIECK